MRVAQSVSAQQGVSAPSSGGDKKDDPVVLGQSDPLTPEEQRQLENLRRIDEKVRAHEQAHLAVGRDLVRGGASYTYQTGPDNKRYAVAGEVSIDTSPGRTPEETVPKAQHIRETALAPADPSAQDRSIAAKATRMENDARAELLRDTLSAGEEFAATYRQGAVENEDIAIGKNFDSFA